MKLYITHPDNINGDDWWPTCAYCGWPNDHGLDAGDDETIEAYIVATDEDEEFQVCSTEHALKLVHWWGFLEGQDKARF